MSKVGLDMSSRNSVEDLLARKVSDGRVETFDTPRHGFSEEDVGDTERQIAEILYQKLGVSEIENIIGYNFREKSFLLQAFTHASYCDNRVTGSYERLEYLGDGVLDYLVTVYIYTKLGQDKDPGKITDIRSAVVCNNMLASVLVSHGLHHFILLQSPELLHMITSYVEDMAGDTAKNNINLINEIEPPELRYVEVPKALGDVFESLMGAIYLDSGHNLKTVWKVFRRLFIHLDAVIANPPKNAKKELLEMFPTGLKISSQPPSPDRELVTGVVTVTKAGRDFTFRGLGHNKTSAQLAACKMALKIIKSNKSLPG